MIASLVSIWFLHLAALLSPGANVLLVSQLAASDRARTAAFAALGVTVGAAIWASSAVLGVHVLFQAFPAVRLALQIAGGLYLLYVASRLWRASAGAVSASSTTMTAFSAFRLGILNQRHKSKIGTVFRERICRLLSRRA